MDTYLLPFMPRPVPRIVWVFWAQGEADAPPLVRACLARLRERAEGWDVRYLDLMKAERLVPMEDVAHVRADSFTFYSDILRLRLLAAHGGVWIDATIWLHRPLADWLPMLAQQGLFMFRSPRPERVIDPWFIAAERSHPLIGALERSVTHFALTRGTAAWSCFQASYCLQHVLAVDSALADDFHATGGLPAAPAFLLLSALEGRGGDEAVVDLVRTGLALSKLTYRTAVTVSEVVRRIDEIENDAAR